MIEHREDPVAHIRYCLTVSSAADTELLQRKFTHTRNVGSRWDLISFATLVVLTVLVLQFGQPRFLVNDDWVMRSFADGTFTGRSESELIFIEPLLGIVLSSLYGLTSWLPWYELLLLMTNLFAFFLLARLSGGSLVGRLGWFLSVTTLFVWLIQFPSFTTTAIVTAGLGAGVIAVRVWCSAGWLSFLLPGLTLLVGLSWRLEAAVPAALFAAFLFLAVAMVRGEMRTRRLVRPAGITAVLIAGAVAFVLVTGQGCLGSDERTCAEWSAWNEYNLERGSFHFTPRGDLLRQESQAGSVHTWSVSETRQFLDFLYFDSEVHGGTALQEVSAYIPNPSGLDSLKSGNDLASTLRFTAWTLVDASAKWALTPIAWIAMMITLLLPTILALGNSRFRVANSLLLVSMGPALSLLMASSVRLPVRVLIPLGGLWMVGLLLLFGSFLSYARPTSSLIRTKDPSHLSLVGVVLVGLIATVASLLVNPRTFVEILVLISVGGLAGFLLIYRFRGWSVESVPLKASLASLILVGSTSILPLGVVSQGFALTNQGGAPNPVFSESTINRWVDVKTFVPGRSTDYFIPQPYQVSSSKPGQVIFGGWPTFSPHWKARLDRLGLSEPRFQTFLSGEIALLADQRDAQAFFSLVEMQPYAESWIDCGPYFPDSQLRVWTLEASTCR